MNDIIIGKESGFEIVKRGEQIIFADRDTLVPAVAAMVNGGIALLAGVWSVISLIMGLSGNFQMPAAGYAAGILIAVCAVFLYLAGWLFRIYRRRSRRPIEEVPSTIVADLSRGVLLDMKGETFCRLNQVSLMDSMDLLDHTRGLMRLLTLKTPQGKIRVFKTNSRRTLDEVKRQLVSVGFSADR